MLHILFNMTKTPKSGNSETKNTEEQCTQCTRETFVACTQEN